MNFEPLPHTEDQFTISRVKRFIPIIQNTHTKLTKLVIIKNSSFKKAFQSSWPHVPQGKSASFNTSVSPLSRGEDGVGVAVSFPFLLPLLLAVRRQSLLQLLVALEEISTRTHDVLLNFAVALHV